MGEPNMHHGNDHSGKCCKNTPRGTRPGEGRVTNNAAPSFWFHVATQCTHARRERFATIGTWCLAVRRHSLGSAVDTNTSRGQPIKTLKFNVKTHGCGNRRDEYQARQARPWTSDLSSPRWAAASPGGYAPKPTLATQGRQERSQVTKARPGQHATLPRAREAPKQQATAKS